DFFDSERFENGWWERKKALYRKREAEIVRIQGNGHIIEKLSDENKTNYRYLLHLYFLIKQHDRFFKEEKVTAYQFQKAEGAIIHHKDTPRNTPDHHHPPKLIPHTWMDGETQRFTYDRLAAVKYAERWSNSYNPEFETFAVDCTNYVSRRLL